MEDLLITLIKKYKKEVKNTQCPTERDVLNSVIEDLERLLYSYRPSATFKLLDDNEIPLVQSAQREEKEKRFLK